MSPPEKARVCGKSYRIEWVQKDFIDEENQGESSPNLCLIRIATGPDIQQRRDTLLHELMHCVWFETGLGERTKPTEEQVTAALSTGLLAVLRDNPEVVEFLLDE